MTENNVKNPQHYKIGNLETIDLIQQTVKDFGSVCQANILKYGIRANKKHDNPKDDIQKIIRYGEFWLNHLEGKSIDKLNDMLNDQEKELIQEKKIKCVVLDGKDVPKEIVQDLIDKLGDMIYGEN